MPTTFCLYGQNLYVGPPYPAQALLHSAEQPPSAHTQDDRLWHHALQLLLDLICQR